MCIKKFNFLIFSLAVLVFTSLQVNAESKVKELDFKKRFESIRAINTSVNVVKATGRSITSGLEDNESKRKALEDALYIASLKGGAEIDAYSSVNTGTELTENILVRPSSRILDYAIKKEYIDGETYVVEIEAVVAPMHTNAACQNRRFINATFFNMQSLVANALPAWFNSYPTLIRDYIFTVLQDDRRVLLTDARYEDVNIKELQNTDFDYDYKYLTGDIPKGKHGQFSIIPKINMVRVVEGADWNFDWFDNDSVAQEEWLVDHVGAQVEIILDVFDSKTYKLAFSVNKNFVIKIHFDSNLELIKTFSANQKSEIQNSIHKYSNEVARALLSQISCYPLDANIELVQDSLEVPLGQIHGIKNHQLAVVQNMGNLGVRVLYVSDVYSDYSKLEPLNKEVEKVAFVGKIANFLE